MRRSLRLLPALLLAVCGCAFGQIEDPNVGIFDPSAACAPTCGVHPNPITLTKFGVWNYGNAGTPLPWYILFAVPSDVGGTPTLASDAASPDSFTTSGPIDVGAYLASASNTEYEFAAWATTLTAAEINAADNSMKASNMFGAAEQAAFGGTPTFYEVFVYSMNPTLPNMVGELFDTSIVAGTFVTALGATSDGKHVFATTFTTAGLGGSSSGSGAASASGPQVPEPHSIVLLGSALLAITAGLRKKLIRS